MSRGDLTDHTKKHNLGLLDRCKSHHKRSCMNNEIALIVNISEDLLLSIATISLLSYTNPFFITQDF